MIVLSDSSCERIGKWETCEILKEGRSFSSIQFNLFIHGSLYMISLVCALPGAFVTKLATLPGVSREAVSKVEHCGIIGKL
jgi:hypothetical protein